MSSRIGPPHAARSSSWAPARTAPSSRTSCSARTRSGADAVPSRHRRRHARAASARRCSTSPSSVRSHRWQDSRTTRSIVALGRQPLAGGPLTERLLAAGERLATAVHPRACVAPSATHRRRIDDLRRRGDLRPSPSSAAASSSTPRPRSITTRSSKTSRTSPPARRSAARSASAKRRWSRVGASIVSGTTVGARTIIGSGAVVVEAIPADVVAFGVPARVRRDRTP